MAAARVLEWIFVLFFLTHVPITLFVDVPLLLPGVYPPALSRFLTWYTTTVKDPLMGHPGPWFKSFLCMESIAPLFFFPVAAYAFWKGNCKWIRTPVVIYTMHVATAATACLAQILFAGFSNAQVPSPQTPWERLTLSAVDAPYLAIPLLMLLFVLFSPAYNQVEKRKKKTIGPPPSGREPCKLGKGRCVCVPRGQSLAKPRRTRQLGNALAGISENHLEKVSWPKAAPSVAFPGRGAQLLARRRQQRSPFVVPTASDERPEGELPLATLQAVWGGGGLALLLGWGGPLCLCTTAGPPVTLSCAFPWPARVYPRWPQMWMTLLQPIHLAGGDGNSLPQ
ncbi:uncharacterized protein LOC134488640 [Candoia aspera]|uniref:uncharacterized protein LOC134488640 n=1 Tax=Candoia aspera TaxID=51853 RepID=UPI002FD7C279